MFVRYPKERMIHDENNVLTDDELVIVWNFSKLPPYVYKMSILKCVSY